MSRKEQFIDIDHRDSEVQALKALEERKVGTFGELHDDVDVSKPTLNNALKDLIEKGEVEKFYDKERDKLLYRLTKRASDPVETILRHLSRYSERKVLDLRKGLDLLSEDVRDFLFEMSTVQPWITFERFCTYVTLLNSPDEELVTIGVKIGYDQIEEVDDQVIQEIEEGDKNFQDFFERKQLDATSLIKVIARFALEKYDIPVFADEECSKTDFYNLIPPVLISHEFDNEGAYEPIFESEEELKEFFEKNKFNPNFFPILGWAKERNMVEKLDDILDWLIPLLESKTEIGSRKLGENPKGEKGLLKGTANRLVADYFYEIKKSYLQSYLKPVWYMKLKGGEKS